MTRGISIAGAEISDDRPCFIIAEIGHNHRGDIELCKKMFASAKESGADAVKLQKRNNKTLYTRAFYDSPYLGPQSFGKTYGEHRERLEFDVRAYGELAEFAKSIELTMFATAFDERSADDLASLGMPAIKIASADVQNIPLLRHVARLGLPLILSTGGSTYADIRRASDEVFRQTDQLAILQCTAAYPPPPQELDLQVIASLRSIYPATVIGLSSHDPDPLIAIGAFVLGARIIEIHFTMDKNQPGSDQAISITPVELQELRGYLHKIHLSLGSGEKRIYASESPGLKKMGKKLVASRNLKQGQVLAPEDIVARSPNDGLSPRFFDQLIGGTLVRDLAEDENVTLSDVRIIDESREVNV